MHSLSVLKHCICSKSAISSDLENGCSVDEFRSQENGGATSIRSCVILRIPRLPLTEISTFFVEPKAGGYARCSSFKPSPTARRFSSFISEYLREMIMPSAPPRNAAVTAPLVPAGVHFAFPAVVGMSTSIPGQSLVCVPASPACARLVSR
jgi:hypothetical protein